MSLKKKRCEDQAEKMRIEMKKEAEAKKRVKRTDRELELKCFFKKKLKEQIQSSADIQGVEETIGMHVLLLVSIRVLAQKIVSR